MVSSLGGILLFSGRLGEESAEGEQRWGRVGIRTFLGEESAMSISRGPGKELMKGQFWASLALGSPSNQRDANRIPGPWYAGPLLPPGQPLPVPSVLSR